MSILPTLSHLGAPFRFRHLSPSHLVVCSLGAKPDVLSTILFLLFIDTRLEFHGNLLALIAQCDPWLGLHCLFVPINLTV